MLHITLQICYKYNYYKNVSGVNLHSLHPDEDINIDMLDR